MADETSTQDLGAAPAEETKGAPTPSPLIAENDDEVTRLAIEGALKAEANGADSDDDFPDPAAEDDEPEVAKPAAKERPEGVPEKFWNAEKGEVDAAALLKSYGELEKKQGTAPAKPDAAPEEAKPEDGARPEIPEGDGTVSELLARDDFNKEFGETGDLADATRAKAAKALEKIAGSAEAARELVDGYVEGLKLRATNVISDIKALVPEGYDKMANWARENLSADEIATFDKEVKSGVREAKLAVRELYARFKAGAEIAPETITGKSGSGAASGTSVYASHEEMLKDMGDPRYRSDEDFRAKVDAKIERSSK